MHRYVERVFEREAHNLCPLNDVNCQNRKLKRHNTSRDRNHWQSLLLYSYCGAMQRLFADDGNRAVSFGRIQIKCRRVEKGAPNQGSWTCLGAAPKACARWYSRSQRLRIPATFNGEEMGSGPEVVPLERGLPPTATSGDNLEDDKVHVLVAEVFEETDRGEHGMCFLKMFYRNCLMVHSRSCLAVYPWDAIVEGEIQKLNLANVFGRTPMRVTYHSAQQPFVGLLYLHVSLLQLSVHAIAATGGGDGMVAIRIGLRGGQARIHPPPLKVRLCECAPASQGGDGGPLL